MALKIIDIPADVQKLATHIAGTVTQIQKDLESGTATELAALLPGGEGSSLQQSLIKICDVAIADAKKLGNYAASPSVEAIFNKLQIDLTQVAHANPKKNFFYYAKCFIVVAEDIANDL